MPSASNARSVAIHPAPARRWIRSRRAAIPRNSSGRNARSPHAAAIPTPAASASSQLRSTPIRASVRTASSSESAATQATRGAAARLLRSRTRMRLRGFMRLTMLRAVPCRIHAAGRVARERPRGGGARGGNPVPMPVSTWVEVDLDRFATNLRAVRELLLRERAKSPDGLGTSGASEPEILLVLKADAYGHGAVEMAQAAEREGVAHFGVATLHEGIQLRQAGCRLPVVVLSPLLPSEIDEAVAHHLDPTVCDLAFAHALSSAAESCGRPLRFHVEVDTGMGRIGVREEEAESFLLRAAALPGLRLASVYTHFPDADAEDLAFAR